MSEWSSDVCSSDLKGGWLKYRIRDQQFLRTVVFWRHIQDPLPLTGGGYHDATARDYVARKLPHMANSLGDNIDVQVVVSSEERRVGKECVSTRRTRWLSLH